MQKRVCYSSQAKKVLSPNLSHRNLGALIGGTRNTSTCWYLITGYPYMDNIIPSCMMLSTQVLVLKEMIPCVEERSGHTCHIKVIFSWPHSGRLIKFLAKQVLRCFSVRYFKRAIFNLNTRIKNIQKYYYRNHLFFSKFPKISPFENFPLYGSKSS